MDWLEKIALGLGIWFVVYPKPYTLLLSLLLLIPLLGIFLNGLTRPSIATLVTITNNHKGESKYDVADFIDFPALVIFLRVLLDYEFESYYSMIIPVTIAFFLAILFLVATHRIIVNSKKSKTIIYLSLLANIALYSYGATYAINCTFDQSDPVSYDAHVIDKRIHHGRRHTTYYVKVTPWGHFKDPEEISVPSDQYNDIEIGGSVKIDLKRGVFNIPWYYIE